VCYAVGDPIILRLSDEDVSGPNWRCIRADELELTAKLAFYLWKAWSIIKIPPI